MLLPVGLFLLLGFALHRFGHNLAHAPGFFVGFTGLGAFLGARDRFRRPENRVIFFGFLGTLVAFFDLMHGSIPIVLSLTILCNHFFYVVPAARRDADRSPAHYWRVALQQALIVFVCFGVAYGALTACRLVLLNAIVGVGWQQYAVSLGLRLGNEIPGRAIGLEDVIQKLWAARFQLSYGGFTPSTWGLFVALAAWVFTLCLLPLACWRRGSAAVVLLADLSIVALAAVGVLMWYRLFRQHTFIHVLFAVRMVAVPAALGVVAAGLVLRFLCGRRQGRIAGRLPRAALRRASPLRICWKATVSVVTSARLVQQPVVDVVACAPVGLKSDGKADGLIELSLRSTQASPPLALAGVRPRSLSPSYLRLERAGPAGWWETGSGVYILGITRRPSSEPINLPDGSIMVPPLRETLWAHFCRDGYDTPNSRYVLHVGDVSSRWRSPPRQPIPASAYRDHTCSCLSRRSSRFR